MVGRRKKRKLEGKKVGGVEIGTHIGGAKSKGHRALRENRRLKGRTIKFWIWDYEIEMIYIHNFRQFRQFRHLFYGQLRI
jgi:hypothetical protein